MRKSVLYDEMLHVRPQSVPNVYSAVNKPIRILVYLFVAFYFDVRSSS